MKQTNNAILINICNNSTLLILYYNSMIHLKHMFITYIYICIICIYVYNIICIYI